MKILRAYYLTYCLLISCAFLQADKLITAQFGSGYSLHLSAVQDFPYATIGFGASDPSSWFPITTNPSPDPVLLSLNRNYGECFGGIEPSPTGLIVDQPGDYSMTITVTLINPGPNPISIPLYLAVNGVYDVEGNQVGSTGILNPNVMTSVLANGDITVAEAGAALTIIATNGESPTPHEIEVTAWGMTLLKKIATP